MKILLLLFCVINSIYSQDNIKKQALTMFDNYSPKIEKSHNLKIHHRKVIIGDLNNDNLNDAIVVFGLAEADANSFLFKQAAVYINYNGKLKVVSGFEPEYCFEFDKIYKGVIYVKELEACILPWPKTINIHKYILENKQLKKVGNNKY
ncbi:hypothetical protein ACXGQW_00955 [Wenyingzhuangia sp. IMCC45533]